MRRGFLFVILVLIVTAAVLLSCGASKKMEEKPDVENELLNFRLESFRADAVPLPKGIDPEPLKQKARDFFEALIDKDFEKASAIAGGDDWEKSAYASVVEIISIGEPFRKSSYKGVYVPYEIRFASGQVKKWQIAMKSGTERKWVFDGGL